MIVTIARLKKFWHFHVPLLSMGIWLHFIIANTASATFGNSINPDDDRSVFSGNIRTAVGGTSFELNTSSKWVSSRPGGVLKKCKIWKIFRQTFARLRSFQFRKIKQPQFTLLGGWIRFLLACAGDRNLLFLEPVYSLKLGVWSGSVNGFVTSDRKFCLENLQEFFCYRQRNVSQQKIALLIVRNLYFSIATNGNVI